MSNPFRIAYIYVDDFFAGILSETEDGYKFKYDEDYLEKSDAKAISLTMPLQTDSYELQNLFPFFDGLIPEGWLLDMVHHNWKVDLQDRFGLLLISCKDPIGNVSIQEKLL